MPIPKTRAELRASVCTEYGKLAGELDAAGPRAGSIPCVDDWTIKDLLAVRTWWTESVVAWVAAGRRGEMPKTPAEGYRWNETPRLNADIVRRSRRQSYRSIRDRLQLGYEQVLRTIDDLGDRELLQAGVFEEWVHHSVHYYDFDNRYFRYIKRHHMYHHSPKGYDQGYGLSNGFWDVILGTRYPAAIRARLHAPRGRRRRG